MLSCTSNRAKLFAENFFKNSNLDYSGMSLSGYSSRTDLKLHNISQTPKLVEKVTCNLDLSKVFGLNCITEVVLKNCESELSYTLPEPFSMYLKESSFPYCWKVSSGALYLRMLGRGLLQKSTALFVMLVLHGGLLHRLKSYVISG